MNQPEVWRHGNPAMGGVASARGLASFYAFLASGARCSGEPFFAEPWLKEMETPRVQGQDQVLLRETAFGPGLMKDPVDEAGGKRRRLFGPSVRAFGHAGAGGSLAFADPDAGLGFACVMNQMVRTVFPTGPVLSLVDALYGEC
jgi:CubicO group peptidase (beta-lactamase class C family)